MECDEDGRCRTSEQLGLVGLLMDGKSVRQETPHPADSGSHKKDSELRDEVTDPFGLTRS
jgi:hypothetical protein